MKKKKKKQKKKQKKSRRKGKRNRLTWMLSMMGWMSSASALSLGFPTSSAQAAMLRHMDPMASDPTPTACKRKFKHSVIRKGACSRTLLA